MVEPKFPERLIVETLMHQFPSMKRGSDNMITYLCYECPIKEKCTRAGKVYLRERTGWSNSYKHVVWCVTNGDEQQLTKQFESAREDKSYSSVLRRLTTTCISKFGSDSRERAMFDYIKLITTMSLPLLIVQDE